MAARALRPDHLPLIGRKLGRKPSATADLYLGFACADLIEDGQIQQFAPTVFRAGRTLIVMRHDAGLRPLPAHDRLIWLVDDDVAAGMRDGDLPLWYRLRLALVEARAGRRLMRAADRIIVPGPAMAGVMRGLGVGDERLAILPPAWPTSHAPLPDPTRAPRRIAWLGAASHAGDARRAADIIRLMLKSLPEAQVIWSANHPLPADLADDPAMTVVPAMNWRDYRAWLARAEFDIGLYPILAEGFNRGRSANKLGEYDQAGAAVLGAEGWQDAKAAAQAGACLLLPPSPEVWAQAILGLCADPARAHDLAAANRLWQSEHGFDLQRRIWADLLPDLDFGQTTPLSPRPTPRDPD